MRRVDWEGWGSLRLGLSRLESQENPMQVFGLPGHLIRNGRAASRLLAAKTPNIEAERRREPAVARWLMARAAGLTAEAAARAVGASRSTLHRWRKRAAPLAGVPVGCEARTAPPALRRSSASGSTFRCGQDQDRAARARVRLCGQRRHGRADPGRPHQARARARRARPLAQARAALGGVAARSACSPWTSPPACC